MYVAVQRETSSTLTERSESAYAHTTMMASIKIAIGDESSKVKGDILRLQQ